MARTFRGPWCLAVGLCLVAQGARGQESTADEGFEFNNLGDSQADLVYTPLTPCRIIDTRLAGGALAAGTTRDFRVSGTDFTAQGGALAGCGVPPGPATAAFINFVAVAPAGPGNLQLTPFGTAMPLASVINYRPGVNIANGLAIAICDPSARTCTSDFTIQANVSATDLVADVQGYFRKTPAVFVDSSLNNTALGEGALVSNTTGWDDTAVGAGALQLNTTGNGNSAFGHAALHANTTGDWNSAVGISTLAGNTTGYENSAFGAGALQTNTTGRDNSAFGAWTLQANTTGHENSAFGAGALNANTTGYWNGAFGTWALFKNTTGYENSAFGQGALIDNTTGNWNSVFGTWALSKNTTGYENSAFGTGALYSTSTGKGNVAVGYQAGYSLTSGDDNVYIANTGASAESGVIRIGTTPTHTATYIAGISAATVSGSAVYVSSNGQLGTVTSSRRYKEQIAGMDAESDVLMKLRPVSFYYRPELDEAHLRQYGLVAEEVAEVAPDLVAYDENGAPQTVRYHCVNAMLLNEVQKQRRLVEDERRLVEQQQDTIVRQESKIQDLEARLARLEGALAGDR